MIQKLRLDVTKNLLIPQPKSGQRMSLLLHPGLVDVCIPHTIHFRLGIRIPFEIVCSNTIEVSCCAQVIVSELDMSDCSAVETLSDPCDFHVIAPIGTTTAPRLCCKEQPGDLYIRSLEEQTGGRTTNTQEDLIC